VARGLFVTGTDTGVGKTVVSAALMHHLRRHVAATYWKPIQTGIEQDDDTAVVRSLGACADHEVRNEGVRLERPVSPHLAARLAEVRIELASLKIPTTGGLLSTRWVVEGAGGVLVPINESDLMIDLMKTLELPVVVVARSGLGTINHTMLTLEALRVRRLDVVGVVMVGDRNGENRAAIESYGRASVLGELPRLSDVTAPALAAWAASELDRDGRMLEALR
jgi:dethiobiotin synthetase